ncbi:hypothetical protein EUGRSUZ_A00627 [Eucalyptus grandis]|uniref:Uncharacterized protein n=2 Tax=Eucalyptus grandis TaxID=71139 RepID=A0ACC3M124_EUCGR|nr:hypothetical protein EUGRSUZ_A00627 [Eucalyptus grandis]
MFLHLEKKSLASSEESSCRAEQKLKYPYCQVSRKPTKEGQPETKTELAKLANGMQTQEHVLKIKAKSKHSKILQTKWD